MIRLYALGSFGSGQEIVAGFNEHGTETSIFIEYKKFTY
jgi:hypothetical protein